MYNSIKKNKRIVIMLNGASIVMGILGLISMYNSYVYITELVEKGLDISGQLIDVINAYSTAATPYIFYTLVLFTLGYIVKQIRINEETDINEDDSINEYMIDNFEL